MKKIIPILIVGALVLSGIGAIAYEADDNKVLEEKITFSVSEPTFSSSENFLRVNLEQETSVRMETGKPMLSVITKTVTFPAGTKINDVQVTYDVEEYKLENKILPAPEKVPLIDTDISQVAKKVVMDEKTYASTEPYPEKGYEITEAYGQRDGGKRGPWVNVRLFVQYVPGTDTLIVPTGEVTINIKYTQPEVKPTSADYDMLIIAPAEFSSNLQPLIDHKNANGVQTYLETVEDIYAEFDGRNEPEDIKLAIKDAIEENGITYVLLAGGRKKQTMDWWIPEFRNNNDDGWESGYAADLYYADVYKNGGVDFEDWDSNENEIFGEWGPQVGQKDIMDFYPDVTLSRISFHYVFELDIVVDKIIAYETGADDAWFKQAIMIAGDTFPGGDAYYEGEMETEHTGDLLESDGFTVDYLFTSLGTFTGVPDVVQAISAGAGFVHFAGHGNPSTWSNHPPNEGDVWITGLSWTDMPKLRNREKLPFIMVGGCHNAQFNATLGNIMHGIKTLGINAYFHMPDEDDSSIGPFWLKEWVPRDFCSWTLLKKNGGSIGSVGHSGLGYGYVGASSGAGLGGWIEPRMFQAYTVQDKETMGAMHDQAIIDYIDIIGMVNADQIDRKTIETFTLLGDPSLVMGGY